MVGRKDNEMPSYLNTPTLIFHPMDGSKHFSVTIDSRTEAQFLDNYCIVNCIDGEYSNKSRGPKRWKKKKKGGTWQQQRWLSGNYLCIV